MASSKDFLTSKAVFSNGGHNHITRPGSKDIEITPNNPNAARDEEVTPTIISHSQDKSESVEVKVNKSDDSDIAESKDSKNMDKELKEKGFAKASPNFSNVTPKSKASKDEEKESLEDNKVGEVDQEES